MDYKKYSLENLENWMNDAVSSTEATPQEIYDVIIGVVKESYYHHKSQASRADELLALLNGNVNNKYEDHIFQVLSCDKDDPSPECQGAWNSFWGGDDVLKYTDDEMDAMCDKAEKDHVKKWVLPVEVSDNLEDYILTLPDDLLETVGWKENDQLEWITNDDGTLTLKKATCKSS